MSSITDARILEKHLTMQRMRQLGLRFDQRVRRMLAQGMSVRAVAITLNLSEATVRRVGGLDAPDRY